MQRENGEKDEGGSEEANQMRHLSNWHATWRSNMQTAGRHYRGGGRGMVPKRAACCMRGKLAMKFRFILPKRALKNAKVFYKKCWLQLATACVASSIYFFVFFWLGFASRQVALRAQAAQLLRHFACVALGLGDLLVGMWRSEHASHS